MKILIDIKHPAHVHFFKNFITIMRNKGNKILVCARDKDMTLYLLRKERIPYITISSIGNSKLSLIKELIIRTYRFYRIAKKFRPSVLMGLMGITIAPVGKLLGIPSLVFSDTENAKLANFIAYHLCTTYITPNCFERKKWKKNLRYNGYHELTYLHPNYFIPNEKILQEFEIQKNEKFILIRFVSWGASHDIGHNGIIEKMKIKAIEEFSKYGKVLVSSEEKLPLKLDKYKIKGPQEKIHHLIKFATLLYGESATMASEAAILGTYAIFLDNEGRGYTNDQEKRFNLVFNFSETMEDQKKSINKGIEILMNNKAKTEALKKSMELLDKTIDVTKLIVRIVLLINKSILKKN